MDLAIPPRIRITPKITYEVRWTKAFANPEEDGECNPHTKQITIKLGLRPRRAFFVFVHEVLHAISFETTGRDLLTEKQVEALEVALNQIFKLNKIG